MWNDQLLIARRLVEAGARCVSVAYGFWDTHGSNFAHLKNHLPLFDRGVSALVEDIYARGLDKDVTVVVWGEFGRTPKINKDAGRDHWAPVNGALLAGGGMKVGQVIGSTDKIGGRAASQPIHYHDILYTIYHNLGIDPIRSSRTNPAAPSRSCPAPPSSRRAGLNAALRRLRIDDVLVARKPGPRHRSLNTAASRPPSSAIKAALLERLGFFSPVRRNPGGLPGVISYFEANCPGCPPPARAAPPMPACRSSAITAINRFVARARRGLRPASPADGRGFASRTTRHRRGADRVAGGRVGRLRSELSARGGRPRKTPIAPNRDREQSVEVGALSPGGGDQHRSPTSRGDARLLRESGACPRGWRSAAERVPRPLGPRRGRRGRRARRPAPGVSPSHTPSAIASTGRVESWGSWNDARPIGSNCGPTWRQQVEPFRGSN